MTIALRAAGAWAAGSTAPAPTIPTGTTTGDIMLLYVGCKPFSATINTPSGWTLITGTDGQNGSTASGIDTGSVRWAVFYRLWLSGDANPTISVTSGNVSLAVIHSYSKTESGWATPAGAKGSDTTSDTAFSLTMDANPGITLNDMLATFATIAGNNATFGTPTLTATGATIGTVTEEPATEGTTATGHDLESSASKALCTAGTATAAPVVGWTLSAAQTGGGAIVRLRETTGTQFNQAVSGALTFTTAFAKQAAKVTTGGLNFTSTFSKQPVKSITGGLTFTSSSSKQTGKVTTGGLTFTSLFTKESQRLLSSTVTFSSVFSKLTGKVVTGNLDFTSTFSKLSQKVLSSSLTFTSTLLKQTAKTITGALSFSGTLASSLLKTIAFTAALTFSSTLAKQSGKSLAGILSFVGAILSKKLILVGRPFLFTSANWGGSTQFFLEVYIRTTGGTVEAELWDVTNGATVTGSNVSTTNTGLTRLRSGAITLVNTREYRLQLVRASDGGGAILGGQIVAV